MVLQKRIALLGLVVTLIIQLPYKAQAWFDTGHEITAAIAEKHLTINTASAVEALLKYPVTSIGSRRLSKKTDNIIFAAVWADAIKEQEYNFSKEDFYSNQHFIDTPLYLGEAVNRELFNSRLNKIIHPSRSEDNIYYGIINAIKALKSPNVNIEDKAIALRFLIHFIGDVHQPMHVVNPIILGIPTLGAGKISLYPNIRIRAENSKYSKFDSHLGFYENITNLHALWDAMGGSSLQLKSPVYANNRPLNYSKVEQYAAVIMDQHHAPSVNRVIEDSNVKDWIFGSYLIANEAINKLHYKVYKDHVETSINHDYQQYVQKVSEEQLYIAGLRLAYLLNALFDPKSALSQYVNYVKNL